MMKWKKWLLLFPVVVGVKSVSVELPGDELPMFPKRHFGINGTIMFEI